MIDILRGIRRVLARLRRRRCDATIVLVAEGFELRWTTGERYAVRWDEVNRIEAYKRDLLAVDLICMDLWLPGRGEWCLLHEEAPGWEAWTEALAAAIPLEVPDWYARIVKPAFAENRTVVYERRPADAD